MGAGGEAAAVVVITLFAVFGNSLVLATLLRRSLLRHPSNRLVLSLTASNLVLALVILPGLVASLVLGSPTTTATRTTLLNHNSESTVPQQYNQTLHEVTLEKPQHRQNHSHTNFSSAVSVYSEGTQEKTNNPSNEKVQGSKSNNRLQYQRHKVREEYSPRNETSSRNKSEPLEKRVKEEEAKGDTMGSVRWESAGVLCQGAAFITNFVTVASAITVAVIALDRYFAIVRPMVYGVMVTGNRCLLMLGWCWAQALLTALPPLLGWAKYEHRGPDGRCRVAWSSSPSYTAVWAISVFLIPVIIMIVCYYFILEVARNKCRRIHVGTVLGSISPPVTPEPSSVCLDVNTLHEDVEPCLGNSLCLPMSNCSGPSLANGAAVNRGFDSLLDEVPCRSHSISGMNRVSEVGIATLAPKRKLGDCGRSLSFCQQTQAPIRPCLRRVQSTFTMRPSLRKKLSLGSRKPSWSWEASPAKGFRTVCVVVGAHVATWTPYSVLAVTEAMLGPDRLELVPHWITVTSTLLLFTASVFYPIIYGLYNRSIRKEVLACLCPSSHRARRSNLHRRTSTLNSLTGSVLDFASLRHRINPEKQDHQSLSCGNQGLLATPIPTISGSIPLTCPTTPTIPPLLLMADYDGLPPGRTYNINSRKPSQDSDCCLYQLSPSLNKGIRRPGAVMGTGDDLDSDAEAPTPTPRCLQQSKRRVSAPSILSNVPEDPHITTARVHTSSMNKHSSLHLRKLPIIPFSSPMLSASSPAQPLRRTRSLERFPFECNNDYDHRDLLFNRKLYSRSLRKRTSLQPLMKETQFSIPMSGERIVRRKGSSVSVLKVIAIPEDGGLLECPQIPDSGRGSVDSGEVSKTRNIRQISIDEGIGADCLAEEEGGSE